MSSISLVKVESMIYVIRGHKVMVDSDLAELYEVETKNLNKAVGRNKDRFPDDFMFQLTEVEAESLRFQTGTSNVGRGGRRYLPYVFTEGGVAMLSSVLTSDEAARVNISIIRTFIRLRSFLAMENSISERVSKLEEGTNKLFKVVFERLDNMEVTVDSKLPSIKKKIGIKS